MVKNGERGICSECGESKVIKSRNTCISCYRKNLLTIDVCEMCKKEKKVNANGLCQQCNRMKNFNNPFLLKCKSCGSTDIFTEMLCKECYDLKMEGKIICCFCGDIASVHLNGMCDSCNSKFKI